MDSPAAEWGLLTGFFLGFYDWAITKRWAFGDFLMMTVYGGTLGPVAVLTIYLASWGVMRTRMYISNKGQPAGPYFFAIFILLFPLWDALLHWSGTDPRGIEEMAHEVLRYLFTML